MVQQKVIKPAMQSEILGVLGWWGHLLCPAIVSSVGPVTIVWEEGGGGGAGSSCRGQGTQPRQTPELALFVSGKTFRTNFIIGFY